VFRVVVYNSEYSSNNSLLTSLLYHCNFALKDQTFGKGHFLSDSDEQLNDRNEENESSDRENVDYNDSVFEEEKSMDDSLLIATGSADGNTFVFSIGGSNASLIQRLEGHNDRVYAVNFHPFDPILASCSADNTIKLWAN